VVEAVAKLREKGYPVQLDFVGAAYTPALIHLRRAIQKFDPKEIFVHYLDEIPHSKLFYLYQQADAFIFASSCENMPNILLEAMASGVPIASSNRGPMPEVLNNAGVYFNPEKPSEITNALKRLIDSPDIRTVNAKAAYEKAKKYTWKNCANNTFTFFNQIATNYNR
jgi:glycosyltransferase involved in cell wall biosynthesis